LTEHLDARWLLSFLLPVVHIQLSKIACSRGETCRR
jgi:hypothetical protein